MYVPSNIVHTPAESGLLVITDCNSSNFDVICPYIRVTLIITLLLIYLPTKGTPYEFASSPKIDGTTFAESLGDWYFHRGKVPTKLLDSCYYVQCNKECPPNPC